MPPSRVLARGKSAWNLGIAPALVLRVFQTGASEVTLTADQYSQIARGYEEAAADPLVASKNRADLAKKAEWFRFLAQREDAKHGLGRGEGHVFPTRFNTKPQSPTRSGRAMAPFLTTLWITGAAVYLIGTVLLTNAVNLFGTQEPKKAVPEITRPVEPKPIPDVANMRGNRTAEEGSSQPVAASGRPHAISPDQPTYESPTLFAPSTQTARPATSELIQDTVQVQPTEMLIVISEATIRDGPSKKAKKIGSATAGAELQVTGRENEFVQFIDRSSGNTGWIQSSLLASPSGNGAEGIAHQPAEASPAKPAKSKLAKKKPSAPAQVSPRPRAYADLPADKEFISPRRRLAGPLSKRRMLREGLMSPDFLPPR